MVTSVRDSVLRYIPHHTDSNNSGISEEVMVTAGLGGNMRQKSNPRKMWHECSFEVG